MKELLDIKNFSVYYSKKQVIHNVDLAVAKGELVAVLGLNGSGKTTLLHGICGFAKVTGNVYIDGQNVTSLNEKERSKKLSFIPQVSGLKDGFSVLDVTLMGYNPTLNFFSYPNEEKVNRAKSILSEVCPTVDINADFSKISSGQKQLVILSRCIVQNSPLMVMDEPDSALDYNNRRKVLNLIKHVIKSNDYAGLIAMHDPSFALNYCDRIIVLNGGKIISEISPKSENKETISDKLSKIYDGIEVIEYDGKFVVVDKNE